MSEHEAENALDPMPSDRDTSGKPAKNQMVEKIIRQKITELKPDIDWTLVTFRKDAKGRILGLESSDPELHVWLQLIQIGS